jgi:hypothetical protein
MTKIAGSGSESGTESGSTIQRHGSADPDPHQNVMDPQHWYKVTARRTRIVCLTMRVFEVCFGVGGFTHSRVYIYGM